MCWTCSNFPYWTPSDLIFWRGARHNGDKYKSMDYSAPLRLPGHNKSLSCHGLPRWRRPSLSTIKVIWRLWKIPICILGQKVFLSRCSWIESHILWLWEILLQTCLPSRNFRICPWRKRKKRESPWKYGTLLFVPEIFYRCFHLPNFCFVRCGPTFFFIMLCVFAVSNTFSISIYTLIVRLQSWAGWHG